MVLLISKTVIIGQNATQKNRLHQKPLDSAIVPVWLRVGTVGPYWGNCGLQMLFLNTAQFLRPEIEALGMNMAEIWWQLDGATCLMHL